MPDPPLLERDNELGELGAALQGVAGGRGRTVVVEGPAGAGKSALLAASARLGEETGMRVLGARGGELEREFAFGAIRQLFETVLATATAPERKRLLAGAAAPAERALGLASSAPADGAPAGLATFHAIYLLAANLAADKPLLLIIDDAHWADASSLRALSYVAARIADVPIALLVALRPDEPGSPAELLDELRSEPGGLRITLPPLSRDSVARIVRQRLPSADEAVCEACHAETAGNPLYLQELLRTLMGAGISNGADPERIRMAAVPSLGDRISRRIAHVAPNAPALAQAMSVIGDGGRLQMAAAVAEMAEDEAGGVAHRLRRIEVLAAEDPFTFVHPLVRRSVYETLSVAERDAVHTAAAKSLRATGGPAEAVAAHLAAVTPAGSAEAAATLVEAAEGAITRAAPDEAVRWYRRALDEDAPEPSRAGILTGLGMSEMALRDPAALPHLQEAFELAEGGALRARIGVALSVLLFLASQWEGAMAVIAAAREELGGRDPETLAELAAIGLMVSAYAPGVELAIDDQILGTLSAGESWAAHALAAVQAAVAAHRGEGVQRVSALADRALEGGVLFTRPDAGAWALSHLLIALTEIDDYDRALAVSEEVSAAARRAGSLHGLFMAADHRGWIYARQGALAAAEAEIRPGLAGELGGDSPTAVATILFFLEEPMLERPGFDDLAELVETLELGELAGTYMGTMVTTVRGRLRLARRERERGIEDLRASVEVSAALGLGPCVSPSRSLLALALPPSEREESAALVAEELELARASGLRRPEGVALRAAGLLEEGNGIELLRESVDLLDGSRARLEHARSLVELGAALRRIGHRVDARAPLVAGMTLAAECGAERLLSRARQEVKAAGGRPRRIATSGAEALTASELRITRLAANGASNPEIAQELFVSLKTVESHLYNAYAKLGLAGQGSRERLAEVLAD